MLQLPPRHLLKLSDPKQRPGHQRMLRALRRKRPIQARGLVAVAGPGVQLCRAPGRLGCETLIHRVDLRKPQVAHTRVGEHLTCLSRRSFDHPL